VKLVAAIPAFNEEKTIGSVVIGAREYVDEVVVVDDGSFDNTALIAERAGAKLIRYPSNRGYGAAIRGCLQYARSNGAGALVILDGDGQHNPEAIPRVLEPIVKGVADLSIGSRFLGGEPSGSIPRYRRLGIGLITRLSNLRIRRNGPLRDAQSGFRAYSRRAIDSIDPREADMGASVEILWAAEEGGLRIVEVPITVDYDGEGSRKGAIHHGLSVLGSMFRYVETERPLTFLGIPGFGLFLLGLGFGVYVIDSYNRTLELPVGLSLVAVLSMVLGTVLGFTGLVLHALTSANQRYR